MHFLDVCWVSSVRPFEHLQESIEPHCPWCLTHSLTNFTSFAKEFRQETSVAELELLGCNSIDFSSKLHFLFQQRLLFKLEFNSAIHFVFSQSPISISTTPLLAGPPLSWPSEKDCQLGASVARSGRRMAGLFGAVATVDGAGSVKTSLSKCQLVWKWAKPG